MTFTNNYISTINNSNTINAAYTIINDDEVDFVIRLLLIQNVLNLKNCNYTVDHHLRDNQIILDMDVIKCGREIFKKLVEGNY